MTTTISQPTLFRKQIALPQDHGSWVFLISPLLIGLFAGGSWSFASFLLIVAALSGFLIRQPVTIVIKIYSHRRPERDVSAAWFWVGIYAAIGAMAIIGLVLSGYSYILLLAIPGIPIFAWYLWLVSRREERRQMGVELIATGVLALSAPAAYWIGTVGYSAVGWWLFLLTWFQGAASIVYAYLRLDQRRLTALPPLRECLIQGRRALLYANFNFCVVLILCAASVLPTFLWIPYTLQAAESWYGTIKPAIGVKPTRIGLRQLAISSIFTLLFIITWRT